MRTVSDVSFDQTTQRAAEFVKRMPFEEVTHQLVHEALALPKLSLARYNHWSEALHDVKVD